MNEFWNRFLEWFGRGLKLLNVFEEYHFILFLVVVLFFIYIYLQDRIPFLKKEIKRQRKIRKEQKAAAKKFGIGFPLIKKPTDEEEKADDSKT